MKRLIALLVLFAGVAFGQPVRIEPNTTVLINSETSTPLSNAGTNATSDTLKPINISEFTDLAVFGASTDSLTVAVWYRLRNSVTGLRTSWTIVNDTVEVNAGDTKGGARIGTIVQSAIDDNDVLELYVDYIAAGTSADGQETAYLYLYGLKRVGGPTHNGSGRSLPAFNKSILVLDKLGWLSSTANDTIPRPHIAGSGTFYQESFYPITSASDLFFQAKSNDSLRVTINYQLYNRVSGAISTSALLDSIVAVSTTITDSTLNLADLAIATILGYDGIRFIYDYNATTIGTSGSAAGDGTNNRWRLYMYALRRE